MTKKVKQFKWPKFVLDDVRRVRKMTYEELCVPLEHWPHDGLLTKGLANHEELYGLPQDVNDESEELEADE